MSVYFMQAGECGPIKIGFSKDVRKRIADMQPGNHELLSVLGTVAGGNAAEQYIHEKFAGHRLRGEWFKPVDAILNFLRNPSIPPDIFDKPVFKSTVTNPHLERAVAILGGPSVTAARIGTSRQALWNWRNAKAQISPEFVLKIERETEGEVTREQLRPDIYPPRAA